MTLQHVVLFSFPSELSAADDAELRRQLASWPTAIGGIGRMRFGTDLTGARTRGYQYLLFTEFADDAALQAYIEHPVHQSFLAWLAERSPTTLAFDYVLDESTVLQPEHG